jgi:hypothetical protein
MASTTLSFTGFSREELPAVQQQFEQAAAGGAWRLVPEAEADVLVIDMDSLYGHMTWLKAHGGGKTTVGVTAGERSETDFLLRRPVEEASLRTLLAQLSDGSATSAPAEVTASPAPPAATAQPAMEPVPAAPASPAAAAAPVAPEAAVTASRAADAYIAAYTTGQMAAMPANLQAHVTALPDFLGQGRLAGPALLQHEGAPTLAFDPASRTWTGSVTLKPLLPLLDVPLTVDDFASIDSAEFERLKAAGGGAQPYLRLLWLAGLAAGHGQLLPGHAPSKKFVLTRWPQIEREYPKHFRIATAMMKGPALLREIVEQAGVPEGDAADFVNAGLVSGVIVVEGQPAQAADVERAVALLARPRPA